MKWFCNEDTCWLGSFFVVHFNCYLSNTPRKGMLVDREDTLEYDIGKLVCFRCKSSSNGRIWV